MGNDGRDGHGCVKGDGDGGSGRGSSVDSSELMDH